MRVTDLSARPQPTRWQRRLRVGLAGVVVGALAAGGALVAAPAQAAVPGPKVSLVAGNGAVTAAWSAVTGASSYTVRVSKKKSLSKARIVTTKSRSLKLAKLKNGTPYYVAVTANGAIATPAIARSAVVKATAASGVPYATKKVTVSAGPGANQITVKWTGGGRALKVAVVAGSNVTTDIRSFHSGWYPATTKSIVLTVPAKYRAYLGAGSGNPVFAKVVQSNSSSTSFGPSYSYERKYRPSPVDTWAFAKAAVPAGTGPSKLRVAELNIQSVGATAGFTKANRWAERAPRAAAYINRANPDLLMTAELATNKLGSCQNHPFLGQPYACRNTTQVADLARRLNNLSVAGTDAYDRVLDQMNSSSRWQGNVTNGSHVFYNPAKMTRLEWGYISPALSPGAHFGNVTGLGVSGFTSSAIKGDRWFSWAKFQLRDGTGRQFFAVAGHLPVGNSATVAKVRLEESQKLVPVLDALAGNLPMVLGADMNGDATRDPKPAQVTFIKDNWFDAAATPAKKDRSNMKVSTANGSGKQIGAKDPGYGTRPVRHPYETSRIDYILLRNSPYTYKYENVLYLHKDGSFIKSLQGTDHNMQLATIGIGNPV